jgi:polar amino acid transport system permease protein
MNNKKTPSIGWYILAVSTVLAFLILVGYLYLNGPKQGAALRLSIFTDPYYSGLILQGFKGTIISSVITLFGSVIFGFILYLFSISKSKYLNALTDVFTEIIYGTPLIVMIIIITLIIGPAFGSTNREVLGLIGLTVYMAPYMKNVYKSAISSIPKEQYMAMDVFGFTPYQRYRYIIIPQVVRVLMPPMMNNFSMIVKGSALLHVISYAEIYYAIKIVQSRTFANLETYLFMWMLYLIVTIPLSQLAKFIERKWSR